MLLPLLLVIVGVAVLLYPVAATMWNNAQQSGQVEAYAQQVQDAATQQRYADEVRQAQEWNAQYQGGPILDPWLARVEDNNTEYNQYLDVLDVSEVMGRVVIPSISSDLPIYHGSDETVLSKGIGHLYGSAFPVGGEGNHAVLTGHTGLSQATLWDNLVDVKLGDAIYIDVAGQKTKYVVDNTLVVLPTETEALAPVPGRDMLTLITCTPYGVNSHRLLVQASRADMEPGEANHIFDTVHRPWQTWMTLVLAAVAAIILLVILGFVWVLRQRKNKKV